MSKLLLLSLAFLLPASAWAGDKKTPVKVFILAGQSNMEGKAKVSLLETQLKQPTTRDLFKHLQKDGNWIERDDVWFKYFDVKGKLTVGYGKPKSIGPELEFGLVVGDHYREQVLLIKTAWGGRSLVRDFRSPSAGLPALAVLEKTLADMKKKKPDTTLDDVKKPYGASYRAMLEEVNGTLANLKTHFPDYTGQGYEIAGFIWFQGWNDMIDAAATGAYTANMTHFIKDVRNDLKSPKLPFVIGQMGVDGVNASGGVKKFKAAQAAVMDVPEFKGNVALVKTDILWDMEADAVFRKGWRENLAEWNTLGSDFPYHYLGSVKTMCRIGKAFGQAVLELRGEATKNIQQMKSDLVIPDVTTGEPSPGKRVRQSNPGYEGWDLHHVVYLPPEWKPGKPYPVIFEYPGNGGYENKLGDRCTGRVEDCRLGYGITGGHGMIWVSLPFVNPKTRSHQLNWWGDADATTAYCRQTAARICQEFGGDKDRLILAGFSRGAIACGYIGLRDDATAKLWRALIPHSHYDGVRPWPYPESDAASAHKRLARFAGKPQFITHELTIDDTRRFLKETDTKSITLVALPYPNHTDAWVLKDVPERQQLREWLARQVQ